MKWFHWVIIICVSVAGVLVWLYMLGTKDEVHKKMEAVRAAKSAKSFEIEVKEPSTARVDEPVI